MASRAAQPALATADLMRDTHRLIIGEVQTQLPRLNRSSQQLLFSVVQK
jgi:hypothetical protein